MSVIDITRNGTLLEVNQLLKNNVNQDYTYDLRAFDLCPPATLSPVTLSQLHCVLKSRTERSIMETLGVCTFTHAHNHTRQGVIMNIIKVKKKKMTPQVYIPR